MTKSSAPLALGHALKRGTTRRRVRRHDAADRRGGCIAFFAVSAYGRVPTMLNFTSGRRAAQKRAQHRQDQAHRHRPALGRDGQARGRDRGAGDYEFVYLEDVREKLSLVDKLAAVAARFVPRLVAAQARFKSRR